MQYLNAVVTIDVAPQWLAIAEKFAAEQTKASQQKLILQQTLAILSLQKYLELAEIKTAPTESYSWHPQTRTLTAWADLLLPDYGRLFCCFADTSQQVNLPPILPINTLGFVVTDISADFTVVYLKGFLPYRYLSPDHQHFFAPEIQLISTLFDELYLLSEKRLLVASEVQRAMAIDAELRDYFSIFLMPENLMDIVNRLNYSLDLDGVEPQTLLFGKSDDEMESIYAVTESSTENYENNLVQEKIIIATAQLTRSLLGKIRELHQDFGLMELS
ncbi:DUF1822 family protein [[Limnothrix rosea] IAM M-220]|uniref:DUF1822 family protein n=1 Tax=[Limnothrix rosea] IAM M-220 TaxID=454133 RepID=UPI00095C1189|nr:DUF1822 family protein [[Limnothrix rosea] IAM M-220]OKH18123.1 hypothetical protein NIES208_07210 [[Limnothrix rosea] IAM M-220]